MRAPSPRVLVNAIVASSALVVISGIILGVSYQATPDAAHGSIVAASSFWRGVHAWAASAALALVLMASVRSFVQEAPPARKEALVGAALLISLMAAFESGAILAWDQRGWEAFQHVQSGAAFLGINLGALDDPGATPLGLVFALHAFVITLIILASVAFLARRTPTLATLAGPRRAMVISAGVVAVAVGVAALVRPPFLGPAPVVGLSVSRPHWPFVWLTPIENALGSGGLLALPIMIAFVAWCAWKVRAWTVPARTSIALAAVVILAILTGWGLLAAS